MEVAAGHLEYEQADADALSAVSTRAPAGEGMSRRHAQYKMVAMVLGTNIVRKEIGLPEAECLAADPRYSLAL